MEKIIQPLQETKHRVTVLLPFLSIHMISCLPCMANKVTNKNQIMNIFVILRNEIF